jgi:hypothetical protein
MHAVDHERRLASLGALIDPDGGGVLTLVQELRLAARVQRQCAETVLTRLAGEVAHDITMPVLDGLEAARLPAKPDAIVASVQRFIGTGAAQRPVPRNSGGLTQSAKYNTIWLWNQVVIHRCRRVGLIPPSRPSRIPLGAPSSPGSHQVRRL